jgi:hypothetical protein
MTKRNGKPIHLNVLKPSTADAIALAQAVEERFLDLCSNWQRIRGEEMPIPKSLDHDLMLWRTARVRHKRGDFRNTEAELRATKAVAQWTVDRNCELRNQEPRTVDWGG